MVLISTSLIYLKPLEVWTKEKQYFITVPPSVLRDGHKVTNEESEPVSDIKIRDFRDEDISQNELDKRGFTFARQNFSRFTK